MLLYLLVVLFGIMYVATYWFFDRDIVCPAFIYLSGYVASIFCALYNVNRWAIHLHWETVFVLVYGTLLFLVASYCTKKFMLRKYGDILAEDGYKEGRVIRYNKKFVWWFCLLQFLFFIVQVAYIVSLVSKVDSVSGLNDAMIFFRNFNSYSVQWMSSKTYFVINQISQIIMMSQYVLVYILTNNYVLERSLRGNYSILLSLTISTVQILFLGGRSLLIIVVAATLLLYVFFRRQYSGYVFCVTIKNCLRVVLILTVGMVMFYYAKFIVGRGGGITFSEIPNYITMYVGGPIQLLDMFLQNPPSPSEIPGKETFYSLVTEIIRLGFVDWEPYIIHLEFRSATTGAFLGNIYTSYRSYLYDFGYIGLTILPILFAVFSNYVYYSFKKKDCDLVINPYGMLYLLILSALLFDYVRCFFFSNFLSLMTVKHGLYILGLCYVFLKRERNNVVTN